MLASQERTNTQLVIAWIGVAICTAGAFACLVGVYRGMRTLMVESGGFCASGGPYVVANECDESAVALLMISLFAGLLFAAGRAAFNAWVEGPGLGLFPSMGILFAVLGYNFIDLSSNPPEGMTSTWGWVVSGVTFWLMALGFMLPLVWSIREWFQRGGQPAEPAFSPSLLATALRGSPASPAPDQQAATPGRPGPPQPPTTPTPTRLVPPDSDERTQ